MVLDTFSWQQFAMVAGAHGLALLSPGPDFFLVVRASMRFGVRNALGVCAGIALGNGVYIALAMAGIAASARVYGLFAALQWTGCLYLAWMGWKFLRARGDVELAAAGSMPARQRTTWLAQLLSGFLSAVLNPKNGLFYASLFAVLAGQRASAGAQVAYGIWMFCAVLLWDAAVATAIRHPAVTRRFSRSVRAVERVTGLVLWGIALAIAVNATNR